MLEITVMMIWLESFHQRTWFCKNDSVDKRGDNLTKPDKYYIILQFVIAIGMKFILSYCGIPYILIYETPYISIYIEVEIT